MSKPHPERKRERFTVISEVKLDDGTVLTPGNYEGTSTQLGFIRHDEYTWTPARHFLDLGAEQIDGRGGNAPEHLTVVEYEVTKYVEDGLIQIG